MVHHPRAEVAQFEEMKRGALDSFRVRGWKTSFYFEVVLWRTKREFLAYRRARRMRGDADACVVVLLCTSVATNRITPKCGEIHFYRGRIGTEAISHECLHAALALMRRARAPLEQVAGMFDSHSGALSVEEILAITLSKMARTIVGEFRDRGHYR